MGTLYFGDNLNILREHIKDESVDLIYLDPPFNSKRGYNLLFKTPKGHLSDAQVTAFADTWHWSEQAEKEFAELLHQPNTAVAEMIQSMRRFLNESDMMAYLVIMANRLIELHRVLKPSGSLYLHCDPTASHYLKIVMDAIFKSENFRNEIIWHYGGWTHAKMSHFPRKHDVVLFYAKSNQAPFRPVSMSWTREEYIALRKQAIHKDEDGREYIYDERGGAGKKRYLDVALKEGRPVDSVWDIRPLTSSSSERLGYPTQKPLALLERIVQASSDPGQIVLDPFCGCGTAIHAAQKLGRNWIGIDITHLAIGLVEKRLKHAFPDILFEILGTPKDLDSARDLAKRNKYEFQWWACLMVNAQPYQGKKKGADGGIDGLAYFQDDNTGAKKIIISVKGGENIGVSMVRDLAHVVEREKAQIGLLVTLTDPTKPMLTEATSAGFYESPSGNAFPKIQILTIEKLLAGTELPRYPDLSRGGLNFKQAKKETQGLEQQELL